MTWVYMLNDQSVAYFDEINAQCSGQPYVLIEEEVIPERIPLR